MIKRYSRTKDAYDFYKSKGGTEDYDTYIKVITYYNKYVINQMINEGRVLRMGRLGTMMVAAVWRNFNKQVVNWGETNKLRSQGIKEMVYFTDNYAVKYYYMRNKFKNRRFYKFKPTRGIHGNVAKLIEANKKDDLLYKKYAQINKS